MLEYAVQVLQKDGAYLVSEIVDVFNTQLCDSSAAAVMILIVKFSYSGSF